MTPSLFDYARSYVNIGWSVFPADEEVKKGVLYAAHPLTFRRKWGQTKDLAQLDEIADFFRSARRIGIATGEKSGLFVFECDTPEGHDVDGFASLAALEATHGKFPDTLQAESPSGSKHFYFRWPGFRVTSSTGKLDPKTGKLARGAIAIGIDVKGDEGMVIAPPSINRDGRAYKWLNDCPISDAPPWLIDHLRTHSKGHRDRHPKGSITTIVAPVGLRPKEGTQAATVLANECAKLAEMEPGDGRSLGLTMAAKAIGRFVAIGEIAEDVARHDLMHAAAECGVLEKKGEAQCLSKIRNGLGYGAQDPAQTVQQMFNNITSPSIAPAGVIPMLGGQQIIAEEGVQIVAAFNLAHAAVPRASDAPQLPTEIGAAPLRDPLAEAVDKMVSMADRQRAALKFDEIGDVLGVLHAAHELTFDAAVARIRSTGAVLTDGKLKKAEERFTALVQRARRMGQGWRTNHKNEPDPRISENVDVLLDRIGAELRYNRWSRMMEYRGACGEWKRFTEDIFNEVVQHAYSEECRFFVSETLLKRCLSAISHRIEIDPALDKINSLVWDGVSRLESWLHQIAGCPNDAYHVAVSRNVAGGIVKRLRHPGAKHDETLLLIGPQGLNKSSVARALALQKDWHCDNLDVNLPVRDLAPAMSGKLIIEFAEIDKYTRKDAAKVKSFITTVNDAGTMKFKDYVSDHYRRCVVVCTTNSDKPLKDATGNRRFLPVVVRRMIDEAWLRENVEQILAEAAHYEAAGHSFGIPPELWATADQHQEAVRDRTPEEDAVQSWFGADVTETSESRWLWASDLSAAFRHQRMNEKAKIGRVMASMGYESDRRTIGGRRDRCWFKNGTTVTARQWLPTLEQGKAVAKWTLLPLPFTPAQQHAIDMRTAPPMPPVFRTTSHCQ